MTRKERLQQELEKLEEKRRTLIRAGKLIQASQLDVPIREKQQAIKECERYEYKPLTAIALHEEIKRLNVYSYLLEIALAADYLSDCAVECKSVFKKLGVGSIKLMDDIEVIRKYANKLSAMPCQCDSKALCDFMMDNDNLIEALHSLSQRYIAKKSGNELDD